jgi:hypothetical protein
LRVLHAGSQPINRISHDPKENHMNTRHRIAASAIVLATLLAGGTAASAAGGNGASPCSESGPIQLGSHTFIDTFGHALVAPTVNDGGGFSGDNNPGRGFDWWGGQAGDGPVVPGVCNPQR